MNFLLICFGTAAGILLCELVLRWFIPQPTGSPDYAYHPDLLFIHAPAQSGCRTRPGVFDFTFSNNSLGLRGRREFRTGPSSSYRVLLLGDSQTYGIGVDDSETAAYLAEQSLRGKRLDVEIINAGSAGKGTAYSLKFYQILGRSFKPNLTVVLFFLNDFPDNQRHLYYELDASGRLTEAEPSHALWKKKDRLRKLPLYNHAMRTSHLANLLKQTLLRIFILKTPPTPPRFMRHGENFYLSDLTVDEQRLTARLLQTLHQSVLRDKGDFRVLYVPADFELMHYRKTKECLSWERTFLDIAENEKLPCESLTPVFAESKKTIDELYYPDGHLSHEGHRVLAQSLTNLIAGSGLDIGHTD